MLLDGLRHVDLFKTQHTFTHQAVFELAGDRVDRVEEALQTFHKTRVGGRIDRRVARGHDGSRLVQLLLGLEQHQRGRRGRAGGADRLKDRFVGVGHVSVDAGRKLRNTRLENAFGEVVQLHGQFGRRKVHTDVLLAGNRQRGELFVVVLHLQRRAVGHQSAVWQTDTQGGADLRAFDGKAVVVLAVHGAGDHKVVLEDFESLPGDHVNGKK